MRWLARILFNLIPYEDRADVVLSTIDAIGARSIIGASSDGSITINGELLDGEKVRQLRESARALQGNSARTLIQEQLTFKASQIALGADTRHQRLFARAAVWWAIEEEKLLKALVAGTSPS